MSLLKPIWFSVLFGGGGIAYLLRDLFDTALAAGSVDGTTAEPTGAYTRNTTDTSGTGVLITAGKLRIVGDGTWNHEGVRWTPGITREAGRVIGMVLDLNVSGAGNAQGILTDRTDVNIPNNMSLVFDNTGIAFARRTSAGTSPAINIAGLTDVTWYYILRANGRFVLYDDGSNVHLLWWDDWDNTATLYPFLTVRNASYIVESDELLIPQNYFNIASYVSAADSFDRANGTLGNTDGAVLAEGGGDGVAWTADDGTWAIATNVATCSALSGGIGIATIDNGETDVLIECALTRSGDDVGVVARYMDSNNYLIAYTDGTNAVVAEVVSGTPNTLITAAVTYSAGASIRINVNGSNVMLYYNELYVGEDTGINAALTGTQHGLYTTNIGNSLDDFVCMPRIGYEAIRP
jgi:hypothetical protein